MSGVSYHHSTITSQQYLLQISSAPCLPRSSISERLRSLNQHFPNNFMIHIQYPGSALTPEERRKASNRNQPGNLFQKSQRCSPDAREDGYSFENLQLALHPRQFGRSWHVADNPAYTLMLDGHMYLNSASDLDSTTNLEFLLERISVTTIDKGLADIAGGLFNLMIVDKQRKRLIITADPTGSMPLYFLQRKGEIFFSGNQFAFLNLTPVFEPSAVEFLKYGFLPFSHSLLEDVRRLLPGQRLSISLSNPEQHITAPRVLEFKPLHHRITDMHEAGDIIHQSLNNYFSRFQHTGCSIALSGGYNSRLLAAWLESRAPRLFHIGTDRTAEAKAALKAARTYNLSLEISPFSPTLLSTYAAELARHFRVAFSVEHSYFFHLHHKIETDRPALHLDSFTGKRLLEDPLSAQQHFRGILNYSHKQATHNTPIQHVRDYQNLLYNTPGALSDDLLGTLLTPDIEVWFLNAARGILEVNRSAGQFHEDFVESLRAYTYDRCFQAARPVSLSAHTLCACPFTDYELRQHCYRLDKALRAGNAFYNHYWKTYFPELAAVGQADADSDLKSGDHYYDRIKQMLYNNTRPFFANLPGFKKHRADFQEAALFHSDAYQALLEDSLKHRTSDMPEALSKAIETCYKKKKLHPRLLLRYLSLNAYLNFINTPDIASNC